MSDDTLLTCQQVADRFQVKVTTIWRRCQQGRMVPPPVPGYRYRFSPVQVQQVIDGTYRATTVQTRTKGQRRQYFPHAKRAALALVNS